MFRSTLPHGERPQAHSAMRPPSDAAAIAVSIHAPARGATVPILAACDGSSVSIHAPARGATRGCALIICGSKQRFDPRSRTGSDAAALQLCRDWHGFDPRSRTGSDTTQRSAWQSNMLFRSTLPHGERPSVNAVKRNHHGVSIHAPARGATQSSLDSMMKEEFRSTLPHGERRRRRRHRSHRPEFRSTLPHGERLAKLGPILTRTSFRSTLPHGERPRAA